MRNSWVRKKTGNIGNTGNTTFKKKFKINWNLIMFLLLIITLVILVSPIKILLAHNINDYINDISDSVESVKIMLNIKDAENREVEVEIKFVDLENQEEIIKNIKNIGQNQQNENLEVVLEKKRKYQIIIKPTNSPIKQIVVKDATFSTNQSEFINLDHVPEDIIDAILPNDFPNPVQVYAIDPTALNFSEAIVTVKAKGTELYKCKEWNFTEHICYSEWIKLMDIIPGQNYTFTLTPEDPAFAETSRAVDVSLAPINNTSFVVAWVDANERDVSFRIMNTNGAIITDTVDADTTADLQSRVAVTPINSTAFVIAWIDGPANDATFAVYDVNGNNIVAATDASTQVGDNTDIAVSQLGDRFALCYMDDYYNDASFRIYYNNGTPVTPEIDIDTNVAPGATLQNLVSCAAINSTRWVYFYFDDQANAATFTVRSETGASIIAPTDIDTWVGETAQVDVTALDNDKFAMVFYDRADQDITIAVRYVNNTVILTPLDIDTSAGIVPRVAITAARANSETSDVMVVAWWDRASVDIKAAVYNTTGEQITAPFTVTTQQDATYRLIDVLARDPITNLTICPGTFIVAYTNASNQGVFNGFYINGTAWNGICEVDNPPTTTLVSPADGNITTIKDVNFTCNATDDLQLSNITFYWNYTGSWQANGTVAVSGTSNEITFVRTNLSNGAILWNCRACDNASQCAFAPANWTVTVNYTNQAPQITLNLPANNTQFNNTQDINFNFTAVDDYNTTLSCSIYLDNVLNQTNSSTLNNTLTNFLITNIGYGSHSWFVNCSDGSLSNVSETRYFTIVDTISPTVTFISPTPANGTVQNVNWVYINVTAVDGQTAISSCLLEWAGVNESMTMIGTGTSVSCYINMTGLNDGSYSYKAYTNDSVNNWGVSETRQVTIDTMAPIVILNSPSDGLLTANTTIIFNCSASDANELNNITLWHNVSGWHANETKAVSGKNNESIFTKMFEEGTYLWSCSACDVYSYCNESVENRTFTISLQAPVVNYVPPTDAHNAYVSRLWTYVNVTVNDPENVSACILEWNGINETMIIIGSGSNVSCYANKTSSEATHNYNVYANDSLGNVGVAGQRTITFDVTPPLITNITVTSVTIKWQTNENTNSSIEYGKNMSLGFTKEDANFVTNHSITLTNLDASTLYYFNITSCDYAGNCNEIGPYNFTTESITVDRERNRMRGYIGGERITLKWKSYNISKDLLESNYAEKELQEKDRMFFDHSINGIKNITTIVIENISSNYIDISIYSQPMYDRIYIGEAKVYDINNDSKPDIMIELINITNSGLNSSAKVRVYSLECMCPKPSEWSDCIEGMQRRIVYECDAGTNYTCLVKEETKPCEIVETTKVSKKLSSKIYIVLIAIGGIIVLIVLISIILKIVAIIKEKVRINKLGKRIHYASEKYLNVLDVNKNIAEL